MGERKSHLFGPVPSRRLGASLGIDLTPHKTCTFDCVYCQLGPTTKKTLERKPYVRADEILEELRGKPEAVESADWLTITASGEPTLNSELGEIVKGIKRLTKKPLAVLTNGSLFWLPEVREAVRGADLVIPSLDAGKEETFQKVNRPAEGLELTKIVEGLCALRREFEGQIWLEVMAVEGVNDSEEEIEALKKHIERISPDKVQINAPVRPPQEEWVRPPSPEKLEEIAKALGGEAIAAVPRKALPSRREKMEDEILSLLLRRPCTLNEVCQAFGLHRLEALKYLDDLLRKGKVAKVTHGGREFYESLQR